MSRSVSQASLVGGQEQSGTLPSPPPRTASLPPLQSRWSVLRKPSFVLGPKQALVPLNSLQKQKSWRRRPADRHDADALPKKDRNRIGGFLSIGQKIKTKTIAIVERFAREKKCTSASCSDMLNRDIDETLVQTFRTATTDLQNSDGASGSSDEFELDDRSQINPHTLQETCKSESGLVALTSKEAHSIQLLQSEPESEPTEPKSRFFFDLPMREVSQHKLESSSDFSDVSSDSSVDLSRLNASHRLEFNLKTGFGRKASHLLPLSNKIVQSMERKKHRFSVLSRCPILVIDPKRKLFEIVTVRTIETTTSLGDLLQRLPESTSDRRLSEFKFAGIYSNGVFYDSPEASIENILASQTSKTPLLAVPENVRPESIMMIGNSILNTPQVKKLVLAGFE